MTLQPRYQHIVSLNKKDEEALKKLIKKEVKIIDVFRAGIKTKEEEANK